MKKATSIIYYKVWMVLIMVCIVCGCQLTSSYDHPVNPTIHIEETARLADNEASPYCDFAIDYTYLSEEGDSVAKEINRIIQHELMGSNYAHLTPSVAIDSFKNDYLRQYRTETGKLYQADLEKNGADTPTPPWYNRTYSLVTFTEEGREGTVNVTANIFEDTGGAHPSQWARWMNFDFNTGKLLAKEDIFLSSAKKDIEQKLLDKLLLQQAEKYPEENIRTLDDLHKLGYLQLTDIYIPDNFLLTKEEVLFLFNRYDIAPYSAGETVLKLSYEEIGPYLIDKKQQD